MRLHVLAVAILLVVITTIAPSVAAAAPARGKLPLVVGSAVVPAKFVTEPFLRERLYDRLVNTLLNRYPACSRLRAHHRLTPLKTTAVVTVSCLAMRGTEI